MFKLVHFPQNARCKWPRALGNRTSQARALQVVALASVSFGFVFVRVRVVIFLGSLRIKSVVIVPISCYERLLLVAHASD